MKTILTLAATGLLALSLPAWAQNAGAPGAVGVEGPLTGSNVGTYGYEAYPPYAYGPGYYEGGFYGPPVIGYGYGYDYGYPPPNGYGRWRTPSERAANPTPETVRGYGYNAY